MVQFLFGLEICGLTRIKECLGNKMSNNCIKWKMKRGMIIQILEI